MMAKRSMMLRTLRKNEQWSGHEKKRRPSSELNHTMQHVSMMKKGSCRTGSSSFLDSARVGGDMKFRWLYNAGIMLY